MVMCSWDTLYTFLFLVIKKKKNWLAENNNILNVFIAQSMFNIFSFKNIHSKIINS